MFAIGLFATVIICILAYGTHNLNFGEFGMPDINKGAKSEVYLKQYDYVKKQGEKSIILSLVLGSLGMIPTSIIMAIIFFFLNAIMYFGLMVGAHYTYGKFYFLAVFVSVRAFNALIVYLYMKLQLMSVESNINTYLKEGGEYYRERMKSSSSLHVNLTEVELKQFKEDDYKTGKKQMYNELNKLKSKEKEAEA